MPPLWKRTSTTHPLIAMLSLGAAQQEKTAPPGLRSGAPAPPNPVAVHLGVPCAQLLVKTRNNPAQSGTKGRDKRAANVSGVYSPAPGTSAAGLRVLLVDDIVTTGATLSGVCTRIEGGGRR